MHEKQNTMMVKRLVDLCMTLLLLFLMAYQVTGEQAHEWIGMGMTALVILHQILNRTWYGAFFKGKYNAYRSLTTAVNVLLLAAFLLTALSGMSMSGYAVPFLYGLTKVSLARRVHLSLSHWTFVLMGLHLGLHIPVITARLQLTFRQKTLISALFCCLGGVGLFLFLKNGIPSYLFFRVPFAFLNYDLSAGLVFGTNILMLLFCAFLGAQVAALCRSFSRRGAAAKQSLSPVLFLLAAVVTGLILNLAFSSQGTQSNGPAAWTVPEKTTAAPAGGRQDASEMADYDTVILGYPNWWASIPMPVASFLETHDFSEKRIIPFCSHGGGRFGQSLTAIAKLAPGAIIGEGLSVHYSGGATFPDDVAVWLDANEMEREATKAR